MGGFKSEAQHPGLDFLIMLYLNLNHPSHSGGLSPKNPGWIYIAYDCRDVSQTKIGITTRPIFDRIFQSTTNTHYVLFAGFHIPRCFHGELKSIENYIVSKLRSKFIPHPTGRDSEWYEISPPDALMMIVDKLPNTGCVEGNEDGYDFTKIIYFPKINPFYFHLSSEIQFDFLKLSSPEIYLQNLNSEWQKSDADLYFLRRFYLEDESSSFFLSGPHILKERINYYLAMRPTFI